MVREFSEEKRQEIFRLLDEIDQKEWKSFMEWCGSRAEEFGDWPDKLSVSAYTRYVDEYHEKVLEINEMTRQQVNTVFENVAEIDARYAARMRECQKKIRDQIAIVRTMTEFMDSMADGKPNMALITEGSVNESIRTEEEVNLPVTSSDDAENETSIYFLNDYFDSREEFDREEIKRILDGALSSGDITQDEYDYMNGLFTVMYDLKDETVIYEEIINIYDQITARNQNKQYNNETNIFFLNDYLYSGEEFSEKEIERILEGAKSLGDINQYEYDNLIILLPKLHNLNRILTDEIIIQSLNEELEKEYNRITRRIQIDENKINIYFLNNYFYSGEELSEDEILQILKGALLSRDITQNEYNNLKELFAKLYNLKSDIEPDEAAIQRMYERIKNEYERITERNQNLQMYINEASIFSLNDYFDSGEEFSEDEISRILNGALLYGNITQNEYNNLEKLFTEMFNTTDETERDIIYNMIKEKYNQILGRISFNNMSIDEINIYFLNDYFDSKREFSEDEILRILDGGLLSGDITLEEYSNLKTSFTEMFDLCYQIIGNTGYMLLSTLINSLIYGNFKEVLIEMVDSTDGIIADANRIQTLYEEIKNEYDRIVERNQYIQIYINEEFLRDIGFKIENLEIDNFVVELKRGMIQYNITDEESIQMFLANCLVETGGTDLLEKYNNRGDAGSGLIHVTGVVQYHFLSMVLARYEEGSPKWEEIKAVCSQFEDANGYYVGYHSTNNSEITPKEYIAENYPIESAVWYWGGYSEKCIVYTDARDKDLGCVTCTINEYVELYQSSCAGREEDLFIATQYYVNSAKLSAPYLQQLCEGYCDQNQNRYCITYFSNGNIVDLAKIEEAAQNNDDTIISQLRIDTVEYQNKNFDAPKGCVARFWYYYRILALREGM